MNATQVLTLPLTNAFKGGYIKTDYIHCQLCQHIITKIVFFCVQVHKNSC